MDKSRALAILRNAKIKLIREEAESESEMSFLGSFDKNNSSYIVDCGSPEKADELMGEFWGIARIHDPVDYLANGKTFAFCTRNARSLKIATRLAHWCDNWLKNNK